jgi:DNA-binding beta-propeller fold protein YncE
MTVSLRPILAALAIGGIAAAGMALFPPKASADSPIAVYGPDGSFLRGIGTSASRVTQLSGPKGVAFDPGRGGRVIVADAYHDQLAVFDAEGRFLQNIGGPDAGEGKLSGPEGICGFRPKPAGYSDVKPASVPT